MVTRKEIRELREKSLADLHGGSLLAGREDKSIHNEDRDITPPGRIRRDGGYDNRDGLVGVRGVGNDKDLRIKQDGKVYRVGIEADDSADRARGAASQASSSVSNCIINVSINYALYAGNGGDVENIGIRMKTWGNNFIEITYDSFSINEETMTATYTAGARLPQPNIVFDLIGIAESGSVPAHTSDGPITLSFNDSSYPLEPEGAYTEDISFMYYPLHTLEIDPRDEDGNILSNAAWELAYSGDPLLPHGGIGPTVLTASHIHDPFTVTWLDLEYHTTPSLELWTPTSIGQLHTFTGVYDFISGTISVTPEDSDGSTLEAPWYINGLSGLFYYGGVGSETVPVPVGTYQIVPQYFSGYVTPGSIVVSVADGEDEATAPIYLTQTTSVITMTRTGPNNFIYPMTLEKPDGGMIDYHGNYAEYLNGSYGTYKLHTEDEPLWDPPSVILGTTSEAVQDLDFVATYVAVPNNSSILAKAEVYNPFDYPVDVDSTSVTDLECEIFEAGVGRSWKEDTRWSTNGPPPFEAENTSPVFDDVCRVVWTAGEADSLPYTYTDNGDTWTNADSGFTIGTGNGADWTNRFARISSTITVTNHLIESLMYFWDRRYCAKIQPHPLSETRRDVMGFMVYKSFSDESADEYVTPVLSMPDKGPYFLQVDRSPRVENNPEYTMMIDWQDIATYTTPPDQPILSYGSDRAEYSTTEGEETGVYEGYYASAIPEDDEVWTILIALNNGTEWQFDATGGTNIDYVRALKRDPDGEESNLDFTYHNGQWDSFTYPAGTSIRVLEWPDLLDFVKPEPTQYGEEVSWTTNYLRGEYKHVRTPTFHINPIHNGNTLDDAVWYLKDSNMDIVLVESGELEFDSDTVGQGFFDYPYTVEFLDSGIYVAPSSVTINEPAGLNYYHDVIALYSNPQYPTGTLTVTPKERLRVGDSWGSYFTEDTTFTVLGPNGYINPEVTGSLVNSTVPIGEYAIIAEDDVLVAGTGNMASYYSVCPAIHTVTVEEDSPGEIECLYEPIDQALPEASVRSWVKLSWAGDTVSGDDDDIWAYQGFGGKKYHVRGASNRVINRYPCSGVIVGDFQISISGPMSLWGNYPNMLIECRLLWGEYEETHAWSEWEEVPRIASSWIFVESFAYSADAWGLSEIEIRVSYV